MIIGVHGKPGRGKTVFMTHLAWYAQKAGLKIYANYNLYGLNFTPVLTFHQLEQMVDGIAFIDELWKWIDSRRAMRNESIDISDVLIFGRKNNIILVFSAQRFHQLDKRIRDNCDYVVRPKMMDDFCCKADIYEVDEEIKKMPTIYFNPATVYPYYETKQMVKVLGEAWDPMKQIKLPIKENPAFIRYLNTNGVTQPQTINKIAAAFEKAAYCK